MKDTDTAADLSKLSAFAVYRKLVPGVKSYEDHKPNPNKRNKKKPKKEEAENGDQNKKKQESSKNGNSVSKQKAKALAMPIAQAAIIPPATPASNDSESGVNVVDGSDKKKMKRQARRAKQRATKRSPKSNNCIHISKVAATATPKQPSKKKASNSAEAEVAVKKKRVELQPALEIPAKKQLISKPAQDKSTARNNTSAAKTKKSLNTEASMSKPRAGKSVQNGSKSIINIKSLINSEVIEDSEKHGRSLFEWMISPTPYNQFFSDYWEKKPLHVKHEFKYFKWLLSSELLDETLRENKLYFGKNVDLTSYTDGVRETHNPEGRALPPVVWDFYSNGCSVRILNPQTYIKNLWRLNASLQELFGTFVGANVYLTPPDTQGFAPHYDDIEAFILQIEGKKHWKLYAPRSAAEELPRFSSGNFNEETDSLGKPILDVVLEEGDLLYFPRGTIHQAKAVDGEHSLHITISCYQTNTYGDLLKQYLPMALEQALMNSVKFRKGIPTDFLSYMGLAHSTSANKSIGKKRNEFHKVLGSLVQELLKVPCDYAADQVGKKFMCDSLPPFVNSKEKERSVYGGGEFMSNGRVYNSCEISPDIEIKLIRKNCMRLLFEDNVVKLYFTLENSLEYHGEEPQVLEIPEEAIEGIKYLISRYPEYTKIQNLPIEDEILKLQTASDLWEKGLLLTKEPLEPTDGGEMNELLMGESDEEEVEDEEDIGDSDGEEFDEEDVRMDDDSLEDSDEDEGLSLESEDEDEFEEPRPPSKWTSVLQKQNGK